MLSFKLYLPITMTLHLLCGRLWPIICPTSGMFVTYRRDCIFREVLSLMPKLTYPRWYTSFPLVHLLRGSSQGFTWYFHHRQDINLVALWYSECGKLTRYEYLHISINLIKDVIIQQYRLLPLVRYGFIYLEICKGKYGFTQYGSLANDLLTERLKPKV